ncbi:MAG: 50S ribosomal protein L28 [Chloroflexi bacterium]|nr:50S ribosomal protein L28 [Chloroflexota bacterium]
MAKCSVCGKGPQFGHNRSHSMKATNRQFKPNVFKRNMVVNGEATKVFICARCLRTSVKPPRK